MGAYRGEVAEDICRHILELLLDVVAHQCKAVELSVPSLPPHTVQWMVNNTKREQGRLDPKTEDKDDIAGGRLRVAPVEQWVAISSLLPIHPPCLHLPARSPHNAPRAVRSGCCAS